MAPALTAKLRDTSWIRNAPVSQLQKKFKHAKYFGIKGSQNKSNLEAYKKALETHVRSKDTISIKGNLHKEEVIHYYNPTTGNNVIKNSKGEFLSSWKLSPEQAYHVMKNGKLGGSK